MFIFSFFADLINQKSLSEFISEPLAILLFGITLFTLTAGLRSFLHKQDVQTEKMLGEMKEAVVIEN